MRIQVARMIRRLSRSGVREASIRFPDPQAIRGSDVESDGPRGDGEDALEGFDSVASEAGPVDGPSSQGPDGTSPAISIVVEPPVEAAMLSTDPLTDHERAYVDGLRRLGQMGLDADLGQEAASDLAAKYVKRYGTEALEILEQKLRTGSV